MKLLEQIAGGIDLIRSAKPLIHHITNYISINDCANVTLAIGGSPIMANDLEEVAEVVSKSSALVLNLGTPNTRMLDSMLAAGKQANELGIPVILDPVGVGFTEVRTRVLAQLLLSVQMTAVRGNLAEISRLIENGFYSEVRGVDAAVAPVNAVEIVNQAAGKLGCLVAATGISDYIGDGKSVLRVDNGVAMLSKVTGTGCMTTSLVAACCGGMGISLAAAAAGVVYMGVAGEIARDAMQQGEGTGMFRVRLMDAVSNMVEINILERGKVFGEETAS